MIYSKLNDLAKGKSSPLHPRQTVWHCQAEYTCLAARAAAAAAPLATCLWLCSAEPAKRALLRAFSLLMS